MEQLRTDRLTLRAWSPDDVDFALDLYSRWEVQQYLGTAPRVLTDRTEAVERVERFMALDHPVHGVWLVTDRDTGRRHGAVLLKPIPASGPDPAEPFPETEIGWHLHPGSWGGGIATEAAARVLARAFAGGLQRVVAVTNPANVPSQRVALRLGMEHRGLTEQFYDTVCELFVAEQHPA